MRSVFVLDKHKKPLMPCHPARARELLKKRKASVYKQMPFTIILKDREGGALQEVEFKVDPGSRKTGIAVVVAGQRGRQVVFAANIEHRGQAIKDSLEKRRNLRRSRRTRNTRYRKPRFDNRTRPKGWLPPSLQSRVDNVANWAKKITQLTPVVKIAVETVRFDFQKMQDPEIKGIEYQQGSLFGYEVREYLLEKWHRKCAYCDAKNVPLEIEHIQAKSQGGSDRVSNLTLACHACNQKKGKMPVADFVPDKARLKKILQGAKAPLKDAAAVNATRYAIGTALKKISSSVSFWSGGRTKHNRVQQDFEKDHWIDAACVGETGASVYIPQSFQPLQIKAQGRGTRQKCRVDRYGFPRTGPKTKKRICGFGTGDLVIATVTKGIKRGTYMGRVAVRANGYFNIKIKQATVQGIHHKYCRMLQRTDGYSYAV